MWLFTSHITFAVREKYACVASGEPENAYAWQDKDYADVEGIPLSCFTWTRTKNDGTRNRSVANYTIKQCV